MSRTARATRNSAIPASRPIAEVKRFESLVNELSAAIAKVTAHAVDAEIESWLGKICISLDLDRSAIYERGLTNYVRTSHTWVRASFPAFPKLHDDPELLVKNTTDWIMAGNRIVFSQPAEIPGEFTDLKRFVARYGPKASAILPMWAGDRVIGAASFGRFRSARRWSTQLLQQLELAVQLFGRAIERKQAEEAARLARAQLAVAQRRSMMAGLIGSLAHELNQPLGAIMSNLGGAARLLSRDNPELRQAATAIKNAIEDTRRAGEILRRARAMFKADQSRRRAVDLSALVDETVRLVSNEAALRRIAVHVKAPRELAKVMGDQVLLQQCVLNLLMNAFESIFESDSGRRAVTIEVGPEHLGSITVTISDSGPGFDPSIAGRLFEPFATTKADGMGLGLLVTRSIIEEHGGTINSQTNSCGGATFAFTIPAVDRKSRDLKRSSRSSRVAT